MKKNLLFFLVALLPMVASAYDAKINRIYYNFSGDEATVTYNEKVEYSYSGTIVIPATVTYNETTYRVTSIEEYAFYNCTGLRSVTIGDSVTCIGKGAFLNCEGLKSVTIGNSVDSIGTEVFWGCSGLTSITIPNNVTSIGKNAFELCTGLTSINIPNSITSIGILALSGCTALNDVFCYAENVPTADLSIFSRTPISSATLHVPASSLDAYKTTKPWSGFGAIVPLTTPIKSITSDTPSSNTSVYYDLNGRKVSNSQLKKGINIIRMNDGTTRKELVK